MGPRGRNCGPGPVPHKGRLGPTPGAATGGAPGPNGSSREPRGGGGHCRASPLLTAGPGPGEGGEGKKRKEGKGGEGQGLP